MASVYVKLLYMDTNTEGCIYESHTYVEIKVHIGKLILCMCLYIYVHIQICTYA